MSDLKGMCVPICTPFDASGEHHHLFDPASGRSASRHAAVSVLAPTAVLADGLSTACTVLDAEGVASLADGFPGVRVRTLGPAGEVAWAG